MALFISFEGGEGSGKSAQARLLAGAIEDLGIPVFSFHEPGSTRLGFHIRDLIKGRPFGNEIISHGAELLLFAASRAELVTKVLSKQMRAERLVIIADRYADSTVAYQGHGRRMSLDLVHAVNRLATQGLAPHRTFLLDCPPERGLERVGSSQTRLFEMEYRGRLDQEGSKRFEEEPLAFHERVRQGYLALAEQEPDRWVVVDATAAEEEVFKSVWSAVQGIEEFVELTHAAGEAADDTSLSDEDELEQPRLIQSSG